MLTLLFFGSLCLIYIYIHTRFSDLSGAPIKPLRRNQYTGVNLPVNQTKQCKRYSVSKSFRKQQTGSNQVATPMRTACQYSKAKSCLEWPRGFRLRSMEMKSFDTGHVPRNCDWTEWQHGRVPNWSWAYLKFAYRQKYVLHRSSTQYPWGNGANGSACWSRRYDPKKSGAAQLGLITLLPITIWLFNIAMGNGPFIGGLPIRNCDFPWLCNK